MKRSKFDKFIEELKALQKKYDMYIQPECDDDFEAEPYLVVYDEETGIEHVVLDDFFI